MDAYLVHPRVVTCMGNNKDLWYGLLQGKSGLTAACEIYPEWFPDKKSKIGALKNLDPKRSRLLQILEKIGDSAIPEEIKECQLILGASSLGDLEGTYAGDPFGCMAFYLKTHYPDIGSKFKGVVSSACSSGTDVVSMASILVDQGHYDIIGVISADCIDPGKLLQHFALGTQSPDTAKPFDKERTGTSFGEGGGFSIIANSAGLKKLNVDDAYKVLGFGMSCDAMNITAPDASGEIPSLAIKRAISSSGCAPSNIRYINAHASGTRLNDKVESLSLRKAFGSALDHSVISGTKGAIGHLLGSTGLVEIAITCMALKHALAPGTVGLTTIDETLEIPVSENTNTKIISNPVAMSTTFGFGGVNSATVIERVA